MGECGYLTVGDGWELRCKLEPGHDGEHYNGAKVFVPITEEDDTPEPPPFL